MGRASKHGDILHDVAVYYSHKLQAHGATPRGVDWNSEESQTLRFSQLLTVAPSSPFSLLDVGCGYGAMLSHIQQNAFPCVRYTGYDLSHAMVEASKKRFPDPRNASFVTELPTDQQYDVVVASGILNVRLEHGVSVWEQYISDTLDTLDRYAESAFAFNMLTSYSDPARMREDLYYGSPERYFSLCKERYSRNVALLHDYGLYEFTLLVRKDHD